VKGQHLSRTIRRIWNSADTGLACFQEAFTPKNLRHILFVHKDVSHQAIVDIPAAGHNPNRTAAQQLLQPPLSCRTIQFTHFRRVDAAESDALTSHTKRIPIDRSYL
jgi:hypothetical protein